MTKTANLIFKLDSPFKGRAQTVTAERINVFNNQLQFFAKAFDANSESTYEPFRSIALDQLADYSVVEAVEE